MHPTDQNIDALLAQSSRSAVARIQISLRSSDHFWVASAGVVLVRRVLGWMRPRKRGDGRAVLQAMLAGWVTYVAAAGMVAEGILLLGRRFNVGPDCGCSAAVLLYLVSLVSVLGVFIGGQPFYRPLLFHVEVILLAAWCGWRWWQLNRSSVTDSNLGRGL